MVIFYLLFHHYNGFEVLFLNIFIVLHKYVFSYVIYVYIYRHLNIIIYYMIVIGSIIEIRVQ